MDQTFNAVFDLHKNAEIRKIGDLARHHAAGSVSLRQLFPRILFDLLNSQRKFLVVHVDVQHHRLDFLPLLEIFGRMRHAMLPGNIRHMNQPVDAVFHADENAEVGDVPDQALDHRAHRIFFLEFLPGIGSRLLQAQRNALCFRIDFQHDHVHDVADVHDFRRMLDFPRPVHFGDMHQTFHARLQFNEHTVVREIDDFPLHQGAHRILFADALPGILAQLLQSQRNAFLLAVERKNLDDDFFSLVENFRRLRDSSPRNVGHVEQAVDAAQVDKNAVVGDVFDNAFNNAAFRNGVEGFFLLQLSFRRHDRAPRQNDVVAFAIIFKNIEIQRLTDVMVQILDRTGIDLGSGQEGDDSDIHGKAALYLLHDGSLDGRIVFADLLDLVPDLELGCFLPRQDQIPFRIPLVDKHFYIVSDGNRHISLGVFKFSNRNKTLCFPADIDHHDIRGDLDDFAAGNIAVLQLVQTLLVELLEAHVFLFGRKERVGFGLLFIC